MRKRNIFPLAMTFLVAFIISCKQNKQSPEDSITATLEFEIKAKLGEGAFWNHRSNELYWIDIEGRMFYKYNPSTKQNIPYETLLRAGTVVPKNDTIAILALEDGIYELDMSNSTMPQFASIEKGILTNRFNDGKCDPNGNLWVGSMRMDETIAAAHLYRVSPEGEVTKMLSDITISNGIVWTKDSKTMYYIDTPTGVIRAFDYDIETSSISNERVAVEVDPADGFPDGMAIDENDHLWVGLWNGNAVACYDPETGKLIRKISVPAHNVTACAFGGENLDVLYITTASVDMTEEEQKQFPLAGSIFVANPGVKGVKSTFFGE